MSGVRERIEGGLLGLLIGDALGVPYEFHGPEALPPKEQIEMEPPLGFRRTHSGTPAGTWSDDGAQALCLLASLLYRGSLDLEDFGNRLVNWMEHGYLAVDNRVFDVGGTTHHALRSIREGTPAPLAGLDDDASNGNGSLMRVLPLVLWHRGPDNELVTYAMAQSRVTHAHLRSQVCCALYCLWSRGILEARQDPWASAVEFLRAHLPGPARNEMETRVVKPMNPAGTGYVVDCLYSARQACFAKSYEDAVKAAIALGNDTDTTACVAGGTAGLMHGVNGIPIRWRSALRGMELVQPLLDNLLLHRGV